MSWRVRAIRKTKQNIGGWWSSLFGIVDNFDRIWSGPDMTTLEPTELVENSSKMIPCCCQRQQDCMVWTSVESVFRVLNSTMFWNKILSPPQAKKRDLPSPSYRNSIDMVLVYFVMDQPSRTLWLPQSKITGFCNRTAINYLLLMEMLSLPKHTNGKPRTQYLIAPPWCIGAYLLKKGEAKALSR